MWGVVFQSPDPEVDGQINAWQSTLIRQCIKNKKTNI